MESDTVDEFDEESGSKDQTKESDNAWQPKSEEELKKWQIEKERYDEIIEYIKEVDEILNLIKPFPRDDEKIWENRQDLVRVESQPGRYGLDHLENIIKLVEQLKQLQENNSRVSERTCCIKDLKKLREHKKRLKNEEMELRSRARARSTASPEDVQDLDCILKSRKISSTASEKLENESEGWQHKRKSLCLTEGQKSKVSKWTKVKEAFHWERTSVVGKPKKDFYLDLPREKMVGDDVWDHSPDDEASMLGLHGFCPPPPPPPPPPRTPRPEELLSVPDFPSSSSSDRLDELFLETQKGTKTQDGDSVSQIPAADDSEDVENLGRKSTGEEFHHLSKEDLATRSAKSNKTTWGKVKDIIQTRKDSLKKKPKKRGSDEFKKRRKLSTLSTSQLSDQFEDLSSPEDKLKTPDAIPRVSYEFPEDSSQQISDEKCSKKLMPALTVTLPSTEELRSSREDLEKRDAAEEEKSLLGHFSCQAQYCEDKSKYGKTKSGQNQRLSRWIKVKRVFLTSGAPSRPANYSPVNDSSPTSQNKSSGFFSDMESDEVSSGEWIDDKSPSQEKLKLDLELQEETRKSYSELQKKLSQEFDQKLREWEMKAEVGKREDTSPKREDGDVMLKARRTRDSMAVPLPSLNDLSPEFKKKLNDWKKMKMSQSSSSVSSSATKEEIQGQNIKIKIGEWQPWRGRCSQKAKCEQEDFSKKIEEGSKVRSRPPSSRRKEKDDGSNSRRDSKRDSIKKLSHSRSPSGGDNMSSGNLTEKDGRFNRRTQKDFQWVEKELQKIEREKMRLEQEKEKYLEREARLEKMKKTIGTACPTQEILVRTPAGFFRFKGINQKFTKKLYEWEKARGIAPEASTFALLEQSARTSTNGVTECEVGVSLQRSKSTGSVPELPSTLLIQTMAHHPSSLSLNDVDEFKNRQPNEIERIEAESEEPEAIIVDVEDIVEETALLADPPSAKGEVPVYTYTTQDSDTVINSTERFYFSTDDVKVVETRSRQQLELYKELQETEMTYRNSNRRLETGLVERSDFQETSDIWMMKDVKSFQDNERLPKPTNDVPEALAILDKKELLGITKEGAISSVEEKPLVSPLLVKSPKTFFEWTASEMNDTIARNLLPTDTDDWKSRNLTRVDNNEAIKKKIKDKITLMQRMSMEGKQSWKFSEEHNYVSEPIDSSNVIINPQRQHFEEVTCGATTSVNVFVPTTRKIISPVKTTQGTTPSVCSYVIDDVKPEESQEKVQTTKPQSLNRLSSTSEFVQRNEPEKRHDIGMPPLPNSPKFYKKLNSKETAPSIRTIINRFNQKISEHESSSERRSESVSPRLWRSPVFGRRTQEKIDKYSKNGEVQKSASLDNMRSLPQVSIPQQEETPIKGILKSSSAGVMKIRPQYSDPPTVQPTKENSPSVMRALKIQKAKEEFLSGRLGSWNDSSSTTPNTEPSTPLTPQIEITNEDFQQSLSKSVSAETITNEKPSTSDASLEKDTRPLQKSLSKFDISSIKSKFRKIRMRKEKDPKLNAVAVLCRQSLFIEVPKPSENQPSSSMSKSCPSSPVMDRNKNEKTGESDTKKK